MESLGAVVGKRAAKSLKKITFLTALIAVVIIIALLARSNYVTGETTVNLYAAELESSMQEKISFMETLANGVSSGAIGSSSYYDYVDTMVEMFDDVSAVYVCVPEDGTIYSDGIMTYMSGGWIPDEDFVVSERSWYQGAMENGGLFISEPYVDEQSGEICVTISYVVETDKGLGVAGLDMYMSDLVTLAQQSYQGNNYIMLVSSDGTILTHPSEKYALTTETNTNIEDTQYGRVYGEDSKSAPIIDYKGGMKIIVSNKVESIGWTVIYAYSMNSMILIVILFIAVVFAASMLLSKVSSKKLISSINPMFEPLNIMTNNVSNITDGNLDFKFEEDRQSEEVNKVTVALNETIDGLKYYISAINEVVGSVANKDLDFDVEGDFRGDYEKIKVSLEKILEVLNQSFAEINRQSVTVEEFADNLSNTSEVVAESATNQSHAVISANNEIENLAKSMNDISELAKAVETNAEDTSKRLRTGGKEMEELVEAMDEIVNCFDGIVEFVSEINSIASQTNLLSLNASIEAARAGEAGRGFAVVASEIQDLSTNSTSASNKIREVIGQSKAAVDHGRKLVERTQNTIQDGIYYSVENTKNVNNIVAAVESQRNSVEEISASFRNISEMVESNAASAEENSAIATQLGECAKALSDTVNEFKLRG